MPTRRDARLRHARHFANVLRELSDRETESAAGRSEKLHGLDNIWAQIAAARDWASKNADADSQAQQVIAALEQAGVEVAQVQAETRLALQRLKDSLFAGDDDDGGR